MLPDNLRSRICSYRIRITSDKPNVILGSRMDSVVIEAGTHGEDFLESAKPDYIGQYHLLPYQIVLMVPPFTYHDLVRHH